jgi:hypothetical protein
MSDTDRVLEFLHAAGPRGITQWQMHSPPDGGKPVERLSARVLEIKRERLQVVKKEWEKVGKSRVARYVHGDYLDEHGQPMEVAVEGSGQLSLLEGRAA